MIRKLEGIIDKISKLPKSPNSNEMKDILKSIKSITTNGPPNIKRVWTTSVEDVHHLNTSMMKMQANVAKLKFHSDSSKRALLYDLIKLCVEMKSTNTCFTADEVANRLKISSQDRKNFIYEYNKIVAKIKNEERKESRASKFGTPEETQPPAEKSYFSRIMGASFQLIWVLAGWLMSVFMHVIWTGWYQILFFVLVYFIVCAIVETYLNMRIWLSRKIDPRKRSEILPKIFSLLDIPVNRHVEV